MRNRLSVRYLMTMAIALFFFAIRVDASVSGEAASPTAEQPASARAFQSGGTEPLFEALLTEVLQNNPELKFYEAEVLAAKGLRQTAGLWNNPEVSGTIGGKRVMSRDKSGESSAAKGAASEIVVTQALEWPGRIRLRKAIAERDIELAELGLEQFRELLRARVKIAVYDLMAAQEKTEAAEEVAEHFRALRQVLIQRDQAGLTPLLEARVIEAIELNIQRKASQASIAAKAALFDLNQLRGAKPEDVLTLKRIYFTFQPIPIAKNELMNLASSKDFQVRLRAAELERQGYRVKLSKNERFPDVTAGPAIAMEHADDSERIIGASISLPLPLWDRNQGNITTAKARQNQAEISLKVAQSDAERRAAEAISTYETKLKEMANWRPDSITHFKEAAELADRHYRLGAVPVSTYIQLQSQYLDMIEGFQDTKKEALAAAVQLELMTGLDLSLTQTNSGSAL
ncbi:MAG: TolC family protein [Candidatus Omnitrophica bacterium]|nr:TolC family protein [Candidatus Omnitrophota bacterium]